MLSETQNIIIDCNYKFNEAIQGTTAPKEIIDNLILLDVEYYSFDNKLHRGQLVIHKNLKDDIQYIFNLIKNKKFPIEKVIPIVKYNWSDDASMADNNTSAFNYRKVAGKNSLSNHSFGIAIDINPFQNPAIYSDGTISPKGASYNTKKAGTIDEKSFITIEFKKLGWTWGGDWNSLKDYQHFQKVMKE
ncbi:MAG: M15 family metallopeptidase [Candidatus Kapaibacteriota bacterium]